ncbi:hypothetical protein [Sphingobium sp.]|uniref:hypothetical protein n=1 Tax=Sphingobium sp. TaxID=1912891 RepID=UPI003BB18041
MTSQTRIANRAFILLGSTERIVSVEDSSPLARQVRDLWHESRREIFALHPWNCLIRRAALNRQGSPAFGYASQYQLPPDCLRWLPWSTGDCEGFEGEEEGRMILTDAAAPLRIRYIADIEDVTAWSVHLQTLMTYKLALDLCESATQIAGNVEEARVRFEGQAGDGGYLAEARRLDGLASGKRANDSARAGSKWLGSYAGTRRAPGM